MIEAEADIDGDIESEERRIQQNLDEITRYF